MIRILSSFPLRSLTLAIAVISVLACHNRRDYYVGPSINGLTFNASSALTGTAPDTLSVGVTAQNASTKGTSIEFSNCSRLNAVSADVKSKDRKWNSRAWELHREQVRKDSLRSSITEVCAGGVLEMFLPPGAAYTFSLRVPVREILGDSLSGGRYQIKASLDINGRRVRDLAAGGVDLSRGTPPDNR
jgi:hypothetical protein